MFYLIFQWKKKIRIHAKSTFDRTQPYTFKSSWNDSNFLFLEIQPIIILTTKANDAPTARFNSGCNRSKAYKNRQYTEQHNARSEVKTATILNSWKCHFHKLWSLRTWKTVEKYALTALQVVSIHIVNKYG